MPLNWIRSFLPGAGAHLALKAGEKAPEWNCVDHLGREVSSRALHGERYLLWFYPAASTPG